LKDSLPLPVVPGPEGSASGSGSASAESTAARLSVGARVAAALRFDGLFWRKFARLGSVYGPEWWKRGSPPFFAAIFFAAVSRNRRGAVANQRRVLGPGASAFDAHRAAFRVFSSFAYCMVESMEYYGPRPRPLRIDEPERNFIAEALERGTGAILVTAHVGNWEISGRALQATGRPVNMVMAREPNETTQEYAVRSRERGGLHVILSDSSVFSAFNMVRAVRRNEILAIQLDRGAPSPTAPRGTRDVVFFGEPAPFQEGPFHLARISGAPVIPVFTLRVGTRHYRIVLGTPRYVSRDDASDATAALEETVAFLEATIRETPEQWFQFAPFWPADVTAPASTTSSPAAVV
jgi:lauroyl/myristoyl acyltransferase